VERGVRQWLRETPFPASPQLLAALVFNVRVEKITVAQLVSVKRALRRLERRGEAIQLTRQQVRGKRLRWVWADPGSSLAPVLPAWAQGLVLGEC
jgi:hypothetical protein